MCRNNIFQLHAGDVFSPSLNHVAAAIDKIEKTVFVAIAGITGMQPAVRLERFGGGIRPAVVLFENRFTRHALNTDFPNFTGGQRTVLLIANFCFVTKAGTSNRGPASLITGAIADDADNGFRHAVRGQQTHTEAFNKCIFFLH
ncbi:hypothetical protein SDC9_145256 [bioreactor metagenome]|uniref:Uncharacterized protein n=1 Tax=bioreactor metagenome TaxID=1076179 RepID=A0A645E9C7_9ZZZZ